MEVVCFGALWDTFLKKMTPIFLIFSHKKQQQE